jgi:predicted metal-dependent HD superfamily phosphohydrolase
MWVVRHVEELLPAMGDAIDRDAVVAAALFHDAIYDPRSATNEADSAALASEQLARLEWPQQRIDSVASLIESTAGHVASDPAAAVLLDADLAILGAPADAYREYVASVRQEYAFVTDEQWHSGRSAILHGFLDRPSIYVTPAMVAQREEQARINIAAELDALLTK